MSNNPGLADLFYGTGDERDRGRQSTVPAASGQPRQAGQPPPWTVDFFGSAPGAPLAEQNYLRTAGSGSGVGILVDQRYGARHPYPIPTRPDTRGRHSEFGGDGVGPSQFSSFAATRQMASTQYTSPPPISYDRPLEYSRLSQRQLPVIPRANYRAGSAGPPLNEDFQVFRRQEPLPPNPDALPSFPYVASPETIIESRKPDVAASDDDNGGFVGPVGRKRRPAGGKKVCSGCDARSAGPQLNMTCSDVQDNEKVRREAFKNQLWLLAQQIPGMWEHTATQKSIVICTREYVQMLQKREKRLRAQLVAHLDQERALSEALTRLGVDPDRVAKEKSAGMIMQGELEPLGKQIEKLIQTEAFQPSHHSVLGLEFSRERAMLPSTVDCVPPTNKLEGNVADASASRTMASMPFLPSLRPSHLFSDDLTAGGPSGDLGLLDFEDPRIAMTSRVYHGRER